MMVKIKTNIKAGGLISNHSEKISNNNSKGFTVRAGVKAGFPPGPSRK